MSKADAIEFLGSLALSVEDAAHVMECGVMASLLVLREGCVLNGVGRSQRGKPR